MLTVVIRHDGEDNVTELTYENLWKELKNIPETELLVDGNWLNSLSRVKTKYVCFVEADCLVNSGYFESQLGLFKKNKYFRKLAMLTSATAVNNWANKFYGYEVAEKWTGDDGLSVRHNIIVPVKVKKSTAVYPVQMGYVPGAIIQADMLRGALTTVKQDIGRFDDLVLMSTLLSITFWKQGDGNRVHINPNATYVTTEDYVNDIPQFEVPIGDLMPMFKKESI